MATIQLTIDGHNIETQDGKSLLEVSLEAGIYIPHLCYHPDLSPIGACRLCLVEIEGVSGLPPSCSTRVAEGMIVKTQTDRVVHARRLAMELLLAGHPADCGTCIKYLNCELQSIKQYLVGDQFRVKRRSRLFTANSQNPLFDIDPNKCVVCGRCVRACHELRQVGVLQYKKDRGETYIGTFSDLPLGDAGCRFCGACAEVCPTGAILDKAKYTQGKTRKAAVLPCRYTCPAEIDIPRYLRFIRNKDYSSAVAVIREKTPFPGVLGYICDRPCESVCRRGGVNQPVSIRELKRFAVEHDTGLWDRNTSRKPSTDKKVAVIGSGPAGLTAAYYLALQGHQVTVFEALSQPGGMLRFGIPEYRLPRAVLDKEIQYIRNAGVEIRTGVCIVSINKLFEQEYHAVLVAVGTHQGQKLRIPGADDPGIWLGVNFLRRINSGHAIDIGKNVLVLGGGNVAFDCARVARRLGAEIVRIACLESRETLPASPDEVEQGESEGIAIFPSRTFTRILSQDGKITGVECQKVLSFSFDEDKNPQIEIADDSQHILSADTIIFAIGQRPEIPESFGLNITPQHTVDIDTYSLTTNLEGVFAAGDAVSGSSSVIKAIASGRKVAIAVDRFLGGSGNIDEQLAPPSILSASLGRCTGFASLKRCPDLLISSEKRSGSFCQVVESLDENTADGEAQRCLQCDLRLKITPIKFWGNY